MVEEKANDVYRVKVGNLLAGQEALVRI